MTAHHTMLQFIASRDHRLMRKVNQWPAPRWIRLWAMTATRAGDGWLWYLTRLAGTAVWRRESLHRSCRGGIRGICRLLHLRNDQEDIGAKAAVRDRATLLGSISSRPINFPSRPGTPLRRSLWLFV